MVSREEVKTIANLSKLYLSDQELEKAEKEIGSMIEFVNQMSSIEKISEINPKPEEIFNAFHEDEVKPSFKREEILENVGGGKDGFFYLSKSN